MTCMTPIVSKTVQLREICLVPAHVDVRRGKRSKIGQRRTHVVTYWILDRVKAAEASAAFRNMSG